MDRVYLYVPFEFKDIAKKNGCKWDTTKKEWYVIESNPNIEQLKDLFHADNFYHNFYGTYMKKYTTTQTERKNNEENSNIEYARLKQEWIDKNGNDKGFCEWYSVVILGHD
jgi:hypothetical protein